MFWGVLQAKTRGGSPFIDVVFVTRVRIFTKLGTVVMPLEVVSKSLLLNYCFETTELHGP